MTDPKKAGILPYLGAIVIVVTATLLRVVADPILQDRQPFAAFLVAVIVAARYCGLAPSLLALFLSALASRFFFMSPRGGLVIAGLDQQASFAFFICFGLFFVFLMRTEQRAKRKLEQEISDRKQIEAELRASQDRFHSFVDNGPFLAFMKDEDGRYVYVNKLCQNNWKRESAQWLGRTDYDLFSKEIADLYLENDRLALQDGSFVHFDEIATTPDTILQHWSTTKFPIQGENGRRLLGGVSVDVTETRLAEQEAKESEARLVFALEAGRLGTFSWNITTNQVQSSETLAVMHGRNSHQTETTLEEAIRNVHPDDQHLMQDLFERILKNQAPEEMAYRVVWPDGSVHWIEAVGRVFCDASGIPNQVMGVCRDTTHRRIVEHRFQGIYEQSPLGIALIDSQSGRFLQINPRYEKIIGRKEEEMVKLTFQEITHPDDLAEDLDNMELLRQGTIRRFQMEKRLLRGDGSFMWASLTVVPMWQVGESPSYHLAMVEDITERKVAEDNLRMRESQLSGILDNTTAVVYLKDSEGRYLLTNRRHQNLFLQDGKAIIGKKDTDIFPETVARKFMESDAKVWWEQRPLDFEEVAPHADGLHTYRSVKFPVRDETGKMIALGGISTDITDLQEAHEALKTERELLRNLIEVQESKKQFICQEFHDGLIQYAVGSLMLLEGCQNKNPSTAVSQTIETVIGNLRRGVEDGRRVIRGIRPSVLDDSGLEAAIDDLVEQYSTSGVMVTSNCDPTIGRLPNSIQTTVYRVVQEALNNATKHSHTDVVRIELKKVNGELHLEIRDFGCGFNVESVRKKGFGLLGMTERVRLLGGECLIQSEVDEGTRISVRLPIPVAGDEEN